MFPAPDLQAALARATTVAAAADAVVAHLARRPGLLPSVYLARDGRLRLQAVRGYWQVRDGFPPSAGVIGRTFRTGTTSLELDVAAAEDYLAAAGSVAAEICVPLRRGDEVVGVLNVESQGPLPGALADELEACAAALAARVAALGGLPAPSPAQRLLVHAARLAELTDRDEVEREVLEAACAVLGMSSGVLLRAGGASGWAPVQLRGPLASVLGRCGPATLAALESLVHEGTSCYSLPGAGAVLPGMAVLRDAGVGVVVAVPLGPGVPAREILVVADDVPRPVATEEVELVELLAAQGASSLRTARALDELREQAECDPLTGLGHHGTFHRLLAETVRPTVALLDIDCFKRINDQRGHQAGDRLLCETARLLADALGADGRLFRIGGDEFAALLAPAAPAGALAVAHRLREAATRSGAVTISVGVAAAAPGEPPAALLARADVALYAVKAAGRDGVRAAAPLAAAA